MQQKNRTEIMSLTFENLSSGEYLSLIEKRLKNGKQTVIFTPNTQILMKCKSDTRLLKILKTADIILPDGSGIVIASHIMKSPIKERVCGIDMAEDILRVAQIKGYSLFLLGGNPQSVFYAKENINKKYPNIKICGYHHGYFKKSGIENSLIKQKISRAAPDILFVCFGFPLQESWIVKNIKSNELSSVKLAMGLGGSIDVWSGKSKRAPKIFQALCMEWLWRAILEPRRLKIIVDIPRFLIYITYYSNMKRRFE